MSAPVPPRFSFSQLSPLRILLVISTGVVPAMLILASPLPFWIRVWLWAPLLGLSAAITFGRVDRQPVFGLLLAVCAYIRRKRKYVWSVRRRTERRHKVVATAACQLEESARPVGKRLIEGAIAYSVTIGITLSLALVLTVGIRWIVTGIFTPSDTRRSVYTASESTPSSTLSPQPLFASVPLSPIPTPTSLPIPTLTSTPLPTLHTPHKRERNILVQSGSLVLENPANQTCDVELAIPGWEYVVSVPALETGKLLVIPALVPQANGRDLTVTSSCSDLDVELVPYRAYHPQRARLWFVPVCNLSGRVQVRPSGPIEIAVLDRKGEQTDVSLVVSREGETIWGPQPPADTCWLYRMVSTQEVWVEMLVYR